ncbi:MAG: PadR family transcriptional regulator [Gemmatimonadales bacterium]|jgi:DNA-binding PadR family transcriptional regulator
MTSEHPKPAEFLPLTDLSFHVLLALGAGASHGYAIGKDIQRRSAGRLDPATGSLYQALRRLQRDGLIEEVERPLRITVDDSRRQYFQLTPLGRRVFAAEAHRLEALLVAARELQLIPA